MENTTGFYGELAVDRSFRNRLDEIVNIVKYDGTYFIDEQHRQYTKDGKSSDNVTYDLVKRKHYGVDGGTVRLKVGKHYRTGLGKIVTIERSEKGPLWDVFYASDGNEYNEDGGIRYFTTTERNIIEEVL